MARFIISDERVINTYGVRVMTAGIDIAQYERNPVLLYMHQRGRVIGKVINLQKEGPVLTGEPVFDADDEFAAEIQRKVDGDWLRACSPELDVMEWSESPELVLMGQVLPTATKSKLYEISICDVPGNDGALRLSLQGGTLRLSQDTAASAAVLKDLFPHLKLNHKPKMKLVLSRLGLSENASEEAALAAIEKVKADADSATAEFILKLAKQAGLVKPEKEAVVLRLAKLDPEAALELLDFSSLKPATIPAEVPKELRLSAVVEGVVKANAAAAAEGGAPADGLDKLVLSRADWTARDWEKKDPDTWLKLKRTQPEIHTRIYQNYYTSRG